MRYFPLFLRLAMLALAMFLLSGFLTKYSWHVVFQWLGAALVIAAVAALIFHR